MNSEIYFTVKEIAKIIGYSKPTVQSKLNNRDIKPDKIVSNKYRYYSIHKTIEIIKEIKPDFNFGGQLPNDEKLKEKTEKLHEFIAKQKGETEKYQKINEKSTENTTKKESDPDLTSRMLEMLQQELEKKDQQILSLQDKLAAAYSEIGDLARKAQELAGQAHYVAAISAANPEVVRSDDGAAATLESELGVSEGASGSDPPPQDNKRSWLRRLLDKLTE